MRGPGRTIAGDERKPTLPPPRTRRERLLRLQGNCKRPSGNQRNVRFDGTCPSAAGAIILAACDYLTQAHSNSSVCNRQSAFDPLVDAAMTTAIGRVIATGIATSKGPAVAPEMIAMAASWAIYGAVKQWFYTPNHPPAEEIVPSILQLVMPILQQAKPTQTLQPVATM